MEIAAPALVSLQKPLYPPVAKRLRVEGDVILSVRVDAAGRVQESRLISGVRQNVGINEAAQEAARTARYRPATRDGKPVEMWVTLRIPFRL